MKNAESHCGCRENLNSKRTPVNTKINPIIKQKTNNVSNATHWAGSTIKVYAVR